MPRKTDAASVRTVGDEHGLASLEQGWEGLTSGSDSPTAQFIWVQAAATALDGGELHTVVVGAPEAPSAIAPLVRRRGRLELIGATRLYEPGDVVFRDHDALGALAEALVRMGRPLTLGRVFADSPTLASLRDACGRPGTVLERPAGECPYVELEEGWKEPESMLSSRRRSDLRRARRRAEELGAVSTDVLTPGPDELEPLLEQAFEIEERSWKGREGTAMASDPARGAFYRRYAAGAAEKGILRLCFLRIGERAVAMQIAAESGGRFWLLKIGYDEEFSRCSPGLLLIADTIRFAAERELTSYEFLGTAAAWTRAWTELERQCASATAYPPRPRGLAALGIDVAGSAARRARGLIRSRG
jgi:CelD/BcsL family acetyltransferase involved in cellulose biosynthesis